MANLARARARAEIGRRQAAEDLAFLFPNAYRREDRRSPERDEEKWKPVFRVNHATIPI